MRARFAAMVIAAFMATSAFAQSQGVAYTWIISRLSAGQQPVVVDSGAGVSVDGLTMRHADQNLIGYAASTSEKGIHQKTITTGYDIELGPRDASTGAVRVRFQLVNLLRMDTVKVGNGEVKTPVTATYALDQLVDIDRKPARVISLSAQEPGRDVITLTLTAQTVKN